VEVNDIIRENPGVKEGIKADQKLRIPFPNQKSQGQKPAGKEKSGEKKKAAVKEPLVKADSIVIPELPCGIDSSTKKPVYKVALMIPLYLDGVAQINSENPDPRVVEKTRSFQFLPYYEGFRMALDSLGKLGLKIRLYVYDVDKDTSRTRQLLRKPEMKSMDLIIGLLYHSNFQMVASFAKRNKINLVNPISERSELVSGNPYVFKVQPSKKNQLSQLAGYMSDTFRKGQILIIRNGQYKDREAPERLLKECNDRNLPAQIVEGREAAITRYSKEKSNFIVVFSDDQTYVLEMMKGMYQLRNEFDLTVIGLPDWSAMEGLETEYLVSLKTHIMSRNFIDYTSSGVKKFVAQYQDLYKTDPELLAFQGFDQAFYFLTALKTYGTSFGRCIGELKMQPLQAKFSFEGSKGNGFENKHWLMYRYEDYRLLPVN
jgi:ABC-type branched-subunit amino acid transport system substrate-binding protein